MSQFRPSMGSNYRSSGMFLAQNRSTESQEIAQALCAIFPFLNITASDIAKPSCEKVGEIYRCIAEKVMNTSSATFSVPPLSATPEGGYDNELFSRVTPKIVTIRAISALLEDISDSSGIEFGMNDIIAPDPKSTRLFLSTLIEFLDTLDRANKEVEFAFSECDKKKAELQIKEREILEQDSELVKLRSESENRKRIANEVREQLAQLFRDSQNLKAEVEAIQENHKADETVLEELITKTENYEKKVDTLLLRDEVTSLKTQLCSLKENLDFKRRERTALQEKKRLKADFAKNIEKFVGVLNGFEKYEKDLIQKEEELQSLAENVAKEKDDLHSFNKLIKKEEEKSTKSDLVFQHEHEQHKQDLANIYEQLRIMGDAAENLSRRLDNVNKENITVQNEISDIRDDMASRMRSVEAYVQKLTSWLITIRKQKLEEELSCKEENNEFIKVPMILNDALESEITENSDTFTISKKIDYSLRSEEKENQLFIENKKSGFGFRNS